MGLEGHPFIMPTTQVTHHYEHSGLWRRLMAMLYDSILIIALMMVITGIATALNSGEAIEPNTPAHPIFVLSLLSVWVGFYTFFWTRAGQTLGMRSWKIKVVSNQNQTLLSVSQCIFRCMAGAISIAIFGLGYWWILFDSERKSLHDRITKTSVIVLPKK